MNYFLAILCIFTLPFSVFSNDISIEIVTKKYSYAPGATTSIPITLVNNKNIEIEYEIIASSLTDHIEIFDTNKKIKLSPLGKEIILIPIKISNNCAVGEQQIVLKITDKTSSDYRLFNININITQKDDLSVLPIKEKEFIKSGDTIYSIFSVKNLGNISQNIEMTSQNGIILDNTKIQLLPQEEKLITIRKITNSKEKKSFLQTIDLNIIRTSNNNPKITAYNHFNVIASNPEELDAYKRLPIQISLSYLNMSQMDKKSNGFQGEIYTKGSLKPNGEDSFELRFLSKNPIEYNAYAQYEEYYAKYQNKNASIHLGDKLFSSSFLTEYARYGRGLELHYDIKNIRIGGFYNKPRFYNNIKYETNVYTRYTINPKNNISIGYLYKKSLQNDLDEDDLYNQNAHLPYITFNTKAIHNTNIETEYAYSITNQSKGTGVRIAVNNYFDKIISNFNYVYTSPTFAGYFRNTQNINGSINYLLSSKISVGINHFQDMVNLQRDTLLLEAPRRKQTQLFGNFRYSKTGYINLYSGIMKNKDRLSTNLFNYEEQFFRLSISQKVKSFQFELENHFGRTNNRLFNSIGTSNLHQLNATYAHNSTFITLFGTVSNTNRYDTKRTKAFYYGGRLSKNIANKTLINVFYQSNYLPEEYFKDRNQFEGSVRQNFNANHSLELSGRYLMHRGQLGDKDFIVSLKYHTQLNLPIKKIIEYSSLTGKISNTNYNIEGIRVRLGNETAITDNNGNYIFKNIVPGEYYLDIDKSTLPIGSITDIKLPTALSIQNIKTNNLDFEVKKAASVKGTIKISQANNTKLDLKKISTANIIIEANDGNQIIRKISSLNNNFDFTYLRPGKWNIKVYANTLPNNFYIQNESIQFELNSGEVKEIEIKINYSQKEVRFQQEAIKIGYIN